jgi:hypothetical protein
MGTLGIEPSFQTQPKTTRIPDTRRTDTRIFNVQNTIAGSRKPDGDLLMDLP